MRRTFDRLTIRARVAALTGVLLAALALVCAATLWSDARNGAALSERERLEVLAAKAASLKLTALELRRNEKDFLLRADETYASQFRRNAERMGSEFAALAREEGLASLASDARAGFADHVAAFERVVATRRALGLDENAGLSGELRRAVHAIEQRLNTVGADQADPGTVAALRADMLMLRRHEKDFMLRGGERYLRDHAALAVTFERAIAAAGFDARRVNDMRRDLATYVAKFAEWGAMSTRLSTEVRALSDAYRAFEPRLGAIVSAVESTEEAARTGMAEARDRQRLVLLVLSALGLVAGVGIAVLVAGSIVGPVRRIAAEMDRLARGETTLDLPQAVPGTEIGAMATSVAVFRDAIVEREARVAADREASRAEAARAATIRDAIDTFDAAMSRAVAGLDGAAGDLAETSGALGDAMADIARRADSTAISARSMLSDMEVSASATEEMTASIREIAGRASSSAASSHRAVAEAERAATAMGKLADTAGGITEVVSLIRAIAEQTNLLALNATIEAARAGEAGRGFAVVASEVKALATQTSRATDDIATRVTAIQDETETVRAAIDGVAKAIDQMSEVAAAVAGAVEEQTAAVAEIAGGVRSAADGARASEAAITGVAGIVVDGRHRSDTLAGVAIRVTEEARAVGEHARRFLSAVKAA